MEKVSIVKCSSYNNKEARKALEDSLKNIDFKFKKNFKILIKPNLLSPSKPEQAIITHPIVIEELCKILKKYNAEIYIGDSSGNDTLEALKPYSYLSKYAKIFNFESLPKKFLNLGKKAEEIPFPELLFEVDLIINLAKLKTHSLTDVSLCVKNLYGCIPGKLKEKLHGVFSQPKEFSKFLLKLNKAIKPQLNIIDGILGMEGDGPGASGLPINSKVLIAGTNALAVDIIASELMGFNSNRIYTNKFSGVKKEDIEIIGNGKHIKLNFRKPRYSFIRFLNPMRKLFPKSRIKFKKELCKKCCLCSEKCPVKSITLNPYPQCNHKKCIKCLCCIEVCPEGAVFLEEHWTKKAVKNIFSKLGRKT